MNTVYSKANISKLRYHLSCYQEGWLGHPIIPVKPPPTQFGKCPKFVTTFFGFSYLYNRMFRQDSEAWAAEGEDEAGAARVNTFVMCDVGHWGGNYWVVLSVPKFLITLFQKYVNFTLHSFAVWKNILYIFTVVKVFKCSAREMVDLAVCLAVDRLTSS